MSTAVSSGSGSLSLMSCVREASPPQDFGTDYETEKTVSSKKRFWNPRKWFKRKNNKVSDDASNHEAETKEGSRSRSTSELSEPEEGPRRRSGAPMHPGLSVSHDSVFHSPNSGSEIELETAQSSSSLTATHRHDSRGNDRLQTELVERLRLRRGRGDTSEDDEGLPRSPCNSPSVAEKASEKDHPKSHSTCSEGSLISVGSSEMDEDSTSGHQSSHNSSKLSIPDGKRIEFESGDLELENVQSTSYPLNHSAAHHRVSVRPSRRHGAPRRRRGQQSYDRSAVLPITLEVNEESSIRSITPEIKVRDAVAELYSSPADSVADQLKCSSLPPGLAPPTSEQQQLGKLHRSRSNAGPKSDLSSEAIAASDKRPSDSFLGKLFPIRRSGKKKKSSREEEKDFVDSIPPKPLPRSGAASRQRVVPNDIPASPELSSRNVEEVSEEKSSSNLPSPLHLELESKLQKRAEKSKVTIAGLSQLQKKALEMNFEEKDDELEIKSIESTIKVGSEVKVMSEVVKCENSSEITISGPSHKAVVQIGSEAMESSEKKVTEEMNKIEENIKITESHSVTKIQVKKESMSVLKTAVVPEFMNIQLHKVEKSNNNNVVFVGKPDEIKSKSPTNENFVKEPEKPKKVEEISSNGNGSELAKSSLIEIEKAKLVDEPKKEIFTVQIKEVSKKEVISPPEVTSSELGLEFPKTKSSHKEASIKEVMSPLDVTTNSESVLEFPKIKKSHKETPIKEIMSPPPDITSNSDPALEFPKIKKSHKEAPVKEVISPSDITSNSEPLEFMKIKKSHSVIDHPSVNLDLQKPDKIERSVSVPEPKTHESKSVRKFSKEDIEIIEKDDTNKEEKKHVATALVTITTMSAPPKAFKKPDNLPLRKPQGVPEKPALKTKSSSLDMVEIHDKSKSESELRSKTHSANDITEVTYRRKSVTTKQKKDDEPELMKVFARRSLKLKDSESEALSQQVVKIAKAEEEKEAASSDKENRNDESSSPEVTLRKPSIVNNKVVSSYQRTVSLTQKANEVNAERTQKLMVERPRTEWIRSHESGLISIDDKPAIIIDEDKPKNFNQRMAEWEKRAQSVRKTTP